ncbi:MAG: putative DNA-binding domain-containing protein [Roseobacter sp.]
MTITQADFREALFDANAPVPDGLHNAIGGPAGARFSVYRNNVIVSLSDALATAFPLVGKLLGAENFGRLAALYVRAHPPQSPLMMFYGEDLPTFLEHFEPLKHIGYLCDCARLDLALRRSYHGADSTAFDAGILGTDAGLSIRIALAPSTHIIRSPWPLFDIWRFNIEKDAPKPRPIAQDVLVTRPEFDPIPHALPKGGAIWLSHLDSGKPFDEAAQRTLDAQPDFDLTTVLQLALSTKALADYTTKETQ